MRDILQARFNPTAAADLDATIEFVWHQDRCRFHIAGGEIEFLDPLETDAAELVVYFTDADQMLSLLEGTRDPISAFMAGEFRSNGYILWAFQALAAFSRAFTPDPELRR